MNNFEQQPVSKEKGVDVTAFAVTDLDAVEQVVRQAHESGVADPEGIQLAELLELVSRGHEEFVRFIEIAEDVLHLSEGNKEELWRIQQSFLQGNTSAEERLVLLSKYLEYIQTRERLIGDGFQEESSHVH